MLVRFRCSFHRIFFAFSDSLGRLLVILSGSVSEQYFPCGPIKENMAVPLLRVHTDPPDAVRALSSTFRLPRTLDVLRER